MNIAIVSVNKDKYSETFIRAQVKLLPARVFLLHTGYLPTLAGYDDRPLVRSSIFGSVKKLLFEDDEAFLKAEINRFLKQNDIRLVLAQYGPSGVKMMDICHHLNIPLLVYFRGYDAYRKGILDSYGKYYPRLFETAAYLFAVSREMVKQLMGLGADERKIIYNPSGADTDMFTYHDSGKNPLVFLSVGRFEETKNHMATILAFQRVVEQFPEARLKIVGEGPLLDACKLLTKSLKLDRSVEFTGILPHPRVAQLMSVSRAFVLHSSTPSSGDREGTPVSVMEASASGLPVVSTLHAGIPDVVTDGETGYLVQEGDYELMAERMLRFARDPDSATAFGKAGHQLINEKFTLKQNITRLWETILRCIEGETE